MAELDNISVTNPTEENFLVRYNGEPYQLSAGASKEFAQHLAIHMAKHLSDKILGEEIVAYKKKRDSAKGERMPFDPKVAQMIVYDNPRRRIVLYDILGDKTHVEQVINAYPFKGFIGNISEYDEYVAKKQKAGSSPVEK